MPPPTPPSVVALSIWTALLLYTAGEYGRTRRPAAAWARPVWLLGAAALLAHIAAAFAIHHGWSHAAAYAYTAARTEALLGLSWGGGLWVNHAFTALWVGEALWWQLRPAGYARRAPAWTPAVRGTFLFMIINGAVVFVDGPERWLGIAVVVVLIAIWRADARAGVSPDVGAGRGPRRRIGADSSRIGQAATEAATRRTRRVKPEAGHAGAGQGTDDGVAVHGDAALGG